MFQGYRVRDIMFERVIVQRDSKMANVEDEQRRRRLHNDYSYNTDLDRLGTSGGS